MREVQSKRPSGGAQRLASGMYGKLAHPVLSRISGVNPLVVYYHVVSDQYLPHISHLYEFRNTAQFARDLDVLLKQFRPLALQDWLRFLQSGQELPPRSFLLTFDDGLRECLEVAAPVLAAKGVPATFFVCSAFVDNRELSYEFKKSLLIATLQQRRLSPAVEGKIRSLLQGVGLPQPSLASALLWVNYQQKQVLEPVAELLEYDFDRYFRQTRPYLDREELRTLLRQGHAVGAHSIDHPRYAELALEQQLHQTRESLAFVKQQFGIPYGVFAFPNSDAGVSVEFFREVLRPGQLDACFGNRGLLDDAVPRVSQRMTMEKTSWPAEAILGKAYARRFIKRLAGQMIVQRPAGAEAAAGRLAVRPLQKEAMLVRPTQGPLESGTQ